MAVSTGTVPSDWHGEDPGDIATVVDIINARNRAQAAAERGG